MADDIEVDLPKPEKPVKEKKARLWPRDFDPLKAPPGGVQHHLPDDEWRAIHGENPLSIYEMRGRYVMVDPAKKSDAGFMGEVIRTEKGCRNCAARVLVVVPDAVVCIGCGATI
jgi:hypothetical protein